jgi:hypothetical protein
MDKQRRHPATSKIRGARLKVERDREILQAAGEERRSQSDFCFAPQTNADSGLSSILSD